MTQNTVDLEKRITLKLLKTWEERRAEALNIFKLLGKKGQVNRPCNESSFQHIEECLEELT